MVELAILMGICLIPAFVAILISVPVMKILKEYTYWNHDFINVFSLFMGFVIMILSCHFIAKFRASMKKNRRSGSD